MGWSRQSDEYVSPFSVPFSFQSLALAAVPLSQFSPCRFISLLRRWLPLWVRAQPFPWGGIVGRVGAERLPCSWLLVSACLFLSNVRRSGRRVSPCCVWPNRRADKRRSHPSGTRRNSSLTRHRPRPAILSHRHAISAGAGLVRIAWQSFFPKRTNHEEDVRIKSCCML